MSCKYNVHLFQHQFYKVQKNNVRPDNPKTKVGLYKG